jgi:hypothetical protein
VTNEPIRPQADDGSGSQILPEEKPSQPAPPEAKAIAWGFIAWIVVAVAVVMGLYVMLKN